MKNRTILCLSLILCVLLVSCAGSNEYKLSYTSEGDGDIEYIYYDELRIVYVVGGIMMAEIDGEPKMLEMALNEGDITVSDILASAKKDAENKKLGFNTYPDGSEEYHYEGFTLVSLNTHLGNRDIYFVPSGMGYYDVIK